MFYRWSTCLPIGLLYDIACQPHHSYVKWDFLGDDLSCVAFSTSVFHAFAHIWPCQLVYHPHKCEGCEHLWSDLKNLVPTLRASGVFFTFVPQNCCSHIASV
ncbi:hypothetical protein PAXRUDRAFT_154693 [Paxillus rubicundulus Ve08.2h10]|uniref:Uncharacterized protein n=1 Tax=Paxillus rubicundulus Ve08.2h10 TaxID=930991 RepID=A0A0D0CH68_9AGAM|nr:hypothetical protein PAXRUDRAFT_154693 [Paxillus rubicundulus Ve08.2h10]